MLKVLTRRKAMKSNRLPLSLLLISLTALGFSEPLTFDSDKTQVVFAQGKERAVLQGNARVVNNATTIRANEIQLYGTDYRYALCKGNVRVVDKDKEINLTSEQLYLDREQNITRAEGNAVMENRKDELVIKGGYIESRDDDNVTIIQTGVRILKKDMVARAEFARYFDETKILELSGMPQVYWKGDEYRASRIIINIDTDEIELQGEVSGSLKNKAKDTEKTAAENTPAQQTDPNQETAVE